MKLESLLKVIFPGYEGEFYPTGSEVYGYPNELSDYDFMVLDPEGKIRGRLVARLEELETEIESSQYFNCIKFPIMDKVVNLIFLGQVNYNAWMKATRAMKAMKKFHESQPVLAASVLQDKILRCMLFQELVIEFGGEDVGLVYERQWPAYQIENLNQAAVTGGLLQHHEDEDIPF